MPPYTDEAAEFFRKMTKEEAATFMAGSKHPIRDLAADVIGGRNVLDLGCGKGIRISELYSPEQYTGVDASAELIELARSANPLHKFYVSGILDFLENTPDKSVECSLMIAVMEHIPTLATAQRIYNEARRVSRELFIGWHTIPNASESRISRVQAELKEPIWQNKWKHGSFGGTIHSRPIAGAELWCVRN